MTAFGYNEKVPEAIRDIFTILCQDVVSLARIWRLYLGLFSDGENAELLSKMARETFHLVGGVTSKRHDDGNCAPMRPCALVRA